jgi:uncharacterized membrane protein YfcA
MFNSRIFRIWFFGMLCLWAWLFWNFNSLGFLAEHWYYPAVMVLGAFVAGLTPEGGGAVAFPVLSVFFQIDRVLARDFSLMIQSVGMTSASVFILSRATRLERAAFKPLAAFLPVCFCGFVAGMFFLQGIPVYLIQALFLSLITTFTLAYVLGKHRGEGSEIGALHGVDFFWLAVVLFLGGICASLFGTGADILIYTLLVTRFRMRERVATEMSIVLMASMSLLGFGYRHFVEGAISEYQVRTWLCAFPVVLFMAPFGAFILSRINIEWMLRGVVLLNIAQLAYFNLNNPSWEKFWASLAFSVALMAVFAWALDRIAAGGRRAGSG